MLDGTNLWQYSNSVPSDGTIRIHLSIYAHLRKELHVIGCAQCVVTSSLGPYTLFLTPATGKPRSLAAGEHLLFDAAQVRTHVTVPTAHLALHLAALAIKLHSHAGVNTGAICYILCHL